MSRRLLAAAAAAVALLIAALGTGAAGAQPSDDPPDRADDVADHWTAQRRAAAQPRDLVVDERGLGYLQRADGSLVPHGHSRPAEPSRLRVVPNAKPSNPGGGGGKGGGDKGGGGDGGSDTEGPTVVDLDPGAGGVIGSSHTFAAAVTDVSGVKSVTFVLTPEGGTTSQSFSASPSGGDRWTVALTGFVDGQVWSWHVVAKDQARKGGNTATTAPVAFTVDVVADGGGGTDGDIVTNSPWLAGGTVQTAAGRIYFDMPTNGPSWGGYVCSGTVVTDDVTGRSLILTAAHCIYDDVDKVFARNVLFIPDQAGTNGDGTDRDCTNDPLGCWAPTFGVVDDDWANRTFPDNIPWDYGFYVVPDSGSHAGAGDDAGALDGAAGHLPAQLDSPPVENERTHALGYSYSDDPAFMYCAEGLSTTGAHNWWLPSCGLSGGSSGGPWLQPVSGGEGPIVSVNSWGYSNQPGMAGPKLSGTSASCLFGVAQGGSPEGADRGITPECSVPT